MDVTVLVLGSLFYFGLLLNLFSLIGNVILFQKMGITKWLGLVPVINDYILYKSFWTTNAFIVYILSFLIYNITVYISFTGSTFIYIISALLSMLMGVALMDKIRLAFGRGIGWLFGLVILYPLFIILLACKYELTEDFAKKMLGNKPTKGGEVDVL